MSRSFSNQVLSEYYNINRDWPQESIDPHCDFSRYEHLLPSPHPILWPRGLDEMQKYKIPHGLDGI